MVVILRISNNTKDRDNRDRDAIITRAIERFMHSDDEIAARGFKYLSEVTSRKKSTFSGVTGMKNYLYLMRGFLQFDSSHGHRRDNKSSR